MKDNFTHVCFIIDESGSMYDAIEDVKGGFKKIIEEQKANTVGTCAVSMYTFSNSVEKHFVLKDVNEVDSDLHFHPHGTTALNDAVGTAIDEIGEVLASMDESERPAANLIVIMTDGGENSSIEYSIEQVREMIKHQTDKYNWTFMYLGADITTSKIADSLGVKYRGYSTKKNLDSNYSMLNSVINKSRSIAAVNAGAVMDAEIKCYAAAVNNSFADETGVKLDSVVE